MIEWRDACCHWYTSFGHIYTNQIQYIFIIIFFSFDATLFLYLFPKMFFLFCERAIKNRKWKKNEKYLSEIIYYVIKSLVVDQTPNFIRSSIGCYTHKECLSIFIAKIGAMKRENYCSTSQNIKFIRVKFVWIR